jgi:hypothetical protein
MAKIVFIFAAIGEYIYTAVEWAIEESIIIAIYGTVSAAVE